MASSKKQGQRLIPEYLLKYATELEENHPDPSESWGGGGGGGDYTAGYGIEISDQDIISIDDEVVALKSQLNGYIKNNDSTYSAIFRGKAVWVKAEGAYTSTSYADGAIGRTIPNQPGYTYTLPNKTGTFAMTSDIITSYNDLSDKPTIPTKTSDLDNDSGFITGVAWDDVTDKPTFAAVATSGDYDDLLNKPTIPTVDYPVTDVQVDGVSVVSNKVASITMPTVPTKVSDLDNDSGFITSSALSGYATETWVGQQGYLTSVSWADVSGKPTFATVATSGSYTDLTDKPTIPDSTSDLQNDSGFITSSALSGYATETWVGQQGYLTSVSWSDVSNKPTFATVATTGDYDDLLNKPTIPTVDYNVIQISRTYRNSQWTVVWPDQATTTLIKANPKKYAFIVRSVDEDAVGDPYFSPLLTVSDDTTPGYQWVATVAGSSNIKTCTLGLNSLDEWDYGESTSSYPQTQYTAGTGISISSGSISVDTTTVALKTDIPTVPVTDVQVNGTSVLSGTVASVSVPTSASSTSTSTSTSTVTPTTQTLVFTLDDDSTVNVTVMTGATVATTTTTSTTTTLS